MGVLNILHACINLLPKISAVKLYSNPVEERPAASKASSIIRARNFLFCQSSMVRQKTDPNCCNKPGKNVAIDEASSQKKKIKSPTTSLHPRQHALFPQGRGVKASFVPVRRMGLLAPPALLLRPVSILSYPRYHPFFTKSTAPCFHLTSLATNTTPLQFALETGLVRGGDRKRTRYLN